MACALLFTQSIFFPFYSGMWLFIFLTHLTYNFFFPVFLCGGELNILMVF